MSAVSGGSKSTNHELMKRVRAAYDNRLHEMRDELEQLDDNSSRRQPNKVDKNATLSEKRLDAVMRQLGKLKMENVSNISPGSTSEYRQLGGGLLVKNIKLLYWNFNNVSKVLKVAPGLYSISYTFPQSPVASRSANCLPFSRR